MFQVVTEGKQCCILNYSLSFAKNNENYFFFFKSTVLLDHQLNNAFSLLVPAGKHYEIQHFSFPFLIFPSFSWSVLQWVA